MSNTFGKRIRITISGTSHSRRIRLKIKNFPKGIEFDNQYGEWLSRRSFGDNSALSKFTTPRKEEDKPLFIKGIAIKDKQTQGTLTTPNSLTDFQQNRPMSTQTKNLTSNLTNNRTTTNRTDHELEHPLYITDGEEIIIDFENKNKISDDYKQFSYHPRPSHADFVNSIKYNRSEKYLLGGGISSGRMTLPIVMAGFLSFRYLCDALSKRNDTIRLPEIKAKIVELGGETNSNLFIDKLQKATELNDSVGAVIECVINNLPIGLGEPFFDSVESIISQLAFSIPGIKGIEFGNGFESTRIYGSENNDCFTDALGHTSTNRNGGVNGGMTNGNPLIFRVAVKPTSSIAREQKTYNFTTNKIESLQIAGRHDICFALRVPVIVESIAAITLAQFV